MNLTGTIISIGRHDRDGEAVHGVLVEIPREQLQQGGILYREVLITGLPVTESTTAKLVAQLQEKNAKLRRALERLVEAPDNRSPKDLSPWELGAWANAKAALEDTQ